VLLLLGAGLIWWASSMTPGPFRFDDIPAAFVRVYHSLRQ